MCNVCVILCLSVYCVCFLYLDFESVNKENDIFIVEFKLE